MVPSAYSPVAAYVTFNTVLTSPSGQPTVWWQNNKCRRISGGADSWTGGQRGVQALELKCEGAVEREQRGGVIKGGRVEGEEEQAESRKRCSEA